MRRGRASHSDEPPDAAVRVGAALAAVPRAGFLTDTERRHAGRDHPLPIGHGQTNSQPTTVRNMLVLLDVQPGNRVLDVGSGSGWTTALLAHLAAPGGRVYGVELVPELADFGSHNLAVHGAPCASNQTAETGVLGLPGHAPYDRILVSAEARELPASLVDQLALRGRMVVPVAGRLSVVERHASGAVDVRRVGHYAFVPLR
jgi:protein-L-isoaspartate(D-aspartate) O-methyltransferase